LDLQEQGPSLRGLYTLARRELANNFSGPAIKLHNAKRNSKADRARER